MRAEMSEDPFYQRCMRRCEGTCSGRITWEHAYIYAGSQIQEIWAIIPLCEHHHLYEGLDKELNQYLALTRASETDLMKYPRVDWGQKKQFLFKKYKDYPV